MENVKKEIHEKMDSLIWTIFVSDCFLWGLTGFNVHMGYYGIAAFIGGLALCMTIYAGAIIGAVAVAYLMALAAEGNDQ